MEGVGTRQRQAQRSSLILDAAYASPSAVHSQMSDRVLTLEKLSYKVARKPETRAACLEFADALGIGHFGAALANETKVKEFMKKPLGVFPVRDRENRIACGFGFGNATVSSTDSGSTLSDPALTHDATVFVDVEDRVTLNVHSGILAHGLREGKRLGNTRRWLGNETLRSKPEPMKDTFGTGVLETELFKEPESGPSTADGSTSDALKSMGNSLAKAAVEQGKWMMDNTAAAKESCVGCLFVWRKIHSAVDQSAGPDTISKMFEQTCAYMPPCFFDSCDAMFSQQEAMVQDYLADVSFWDMCIYAGLCWTGLGVL
eukprot:INCI4356.1.p1 GENE.INCI4356.1~~INCI4356.1.p1  ORF type:complete len:362 (-),score=54.32 INCI4356.1:621-1568(-)